MTALVADVGLVFGLASGAKVEVDDCHVRVHLDVRLKLEEAPETKKMITIFVCDHRGKVWQQRAAGEEQHRQL